MLGTKILEIRQSKYNGELRVVKTWGMGNYIQAGGLTQSGGIVESIWKQTIKHMAYSMKHDVKNVLILGLGGGTVAKLIHKNYPDVKITGVEIDPVMVELGKKYLDLSDVKIVIGNALKYKIGKFDLVIVDTYLGDKYIDIAKSSFKNAKLVIFNRLYYKDKKLEAEKFGEKIKKIFRKVDYFYPEANLMFFCYN